MNIIKATKAVMQILKEYEPNRIENPDRFGEHRVGSVPNFYRQMGFPFGIFLYFKMTKSQMSRNIFESFEETTKALTVPRNSKFASIIKSGEFAVCA